MICHVARKKYSNRITEVDGTEDAELVAAADKAVPLGRKTVIEYNFLEGLIKSLTNAAEARPMLNQTISSMDAASLLQTDIEPSIWGFVGQVLRGESLK